MAETTQAAPQGDTGSAGKQETQATAPAGDKGTTQAPPANAQPAKQETVLTQTAEGNKDGAAAKPEGDKGAQTDIQITVPKGVEFDQGLIDGFKGVAKEIGLTSENAQKVADWYFKASEEAVKQMQATKESEVVKWAEEAKADKEIGGPNFDANLKTAQAALRQFGSEGLTKLLNETGLGNHKEVISLFAKIGKSIAEDKLPKGAVASGEAKKQDVPLEELLYPTMSQPT